MTEARRSHQCFQCAGRIEIGMGGSVIVPHEHGVEPSLRFHRDCYDKWMLRQGRSTNLANMAIIEWLARGRTGTSSETMAFWLGFGVRRSGASHPHDPDDLDCCLHLLAAAPTLRERLPRMADISPQWAALVDAWDEIERSHLDEVGLGWTKARSAPKTYALMRAAIDSRNPSRSTA